MASSIRPRPARTAPKVVMGLRAVGLDGEHLPVTGDSLVDLAAVGQGVAKVEQASANPG